MTLICRFELILDRLHHALTIQKGFINSKIYALENGSSQLNLEEKLKGKHDKDCVTKISLCSWVGQFSL